jgi:hypothetical protein
MIVERVPFLLALAFGLAVLVFRELAPLSRGLVRVEVRW